ncbi:MAG: chitobiase/beta-hexosaminidase C-terminal domain-containing protein [Candidatus Cloacimonadaceae bacterium]
MKKILLVLAVLLTLGMVHGQTLVYYWNFNTGTPAQDQTWAQPIASTIGDAELTYSFTEAFSFSGTTINGIDGEVNGGSFAPRGGNGSDGNFENNGGHFTLTFSTVGYENIIISYPIRRTSTGFTTQTFEYTINGQDWINKETVDISDWGTQWGTNQILEVNFSGIAGVANNPNFAVRVVLNGASSAVGNNRMDNIRVTASSQGAVAMPVFDPPAGVYTSAIDVSITSATDGAEIRYTTDGSDPSASSTLYSNPIHLTANTTLKARAFADGFEPSVVASADYFFPIVVQDITELRQQTEGTGAIYMIAGEVVLTFKQSFRNQKWVQDAGRGIVIDDQSGNITTNYQIGDGITGLTGTISRYANLLQFVPASDPGAPSSTGNEVTPLNATISDINANPELYQSRLVKINNAHFVGASGNFETGKNYTMADPTGEIVFRTAFFNANYIDTEIPADNFAVTGLVGQFNQNAQFTARSLEDWGPVPNDDYVVNPMQTKLLGNYPNPFNPSTTIEFTLENVGDAELVIYNIKGQAVRHFNITAAKQGINRITWDGCDDNGNLQASGAYLFRLRSGRYSSTKKMIMMK